MADSARAHLIFSFRKVLRPLIKILIRAGVTYDEFREVIKGAYVETAVRDGVGQPGPITRERIAVFTGVPGGDINRFIDDASLLAPPDATNAAVIAEVLHIWNTDPNYLGPYSIPLEIDFDATPNRNLSDLVYRADPTADPSVILDEMVETGLVTQVGHKHFKAGTRSYLFADIMSPQALEYFGRVMADLAQTLEFNMAVRPGQEKRLQRSVVADGGIPDYALPEFEALLKDRVQALLVEVDDWLSQNMNRWGDRTNVVNTGLTVFHYVSEDLDFRPLQELDNLFQASRLKNSKHPKT
ncbi:MAG: DUF6502 family protein [Steroidobacteraceae bacterium]